MVAGPPGNHELFFGKISVRYSAALASVRAGDDLGNFRSLLGRARFSPLGFAGGSPDAQLRAVPALRWAAPYAPASPSEIGIFSEEGDCRLAPTGTAC